MQSRLVETTREMRSSGVAPDPPSDGAEAAEATAAEATEAGAAVSDADGGAAAEAGGEEAERPREMEADAALDPVEEMLRALDPVHPVEEMRRAYRRESRPRLAVIRAREGDRERGDVDDATSATAWACILCGEWNARSDSHCVQCNTPLISGPLRRKLEHVEGADATRARPKALAPGPRRLRHSPRSLGLGRRWRMSSMERQEERVRIDRAARGGAGDGGGMGGAEAIFAALSSATHNSVHDNRLRYRLDDDRTRWACPVCTLHNEMHSVMCAACGMMP
jgi:hypothetical protein